MIIDHTETAQGYTVSLLAALIRKHMQTWQRMQTLREYYDGEHKILRRKKAAGGTANNRIVCNHAKYITDMTQAYLTGNPVTYAPAEGYNIEALKNAYLEQDMAGIDCDLVKDMSIYGRGYELVYADETGEARSVRLAPESAFVCYDASAGKKALFGVYYYKKYNLEGRCTGVRCTVYDAAGATVFSGEGDRFDTMVQTGFEPHFFGAVPLVEYQNNDTCTGDFEQLIPLIDAYNLLMSDRVNDKEQFVDAFLFLRNIDIDSEQAKKLKEEKILMGTEDAYAQYLSKVMSEADIKILRDDLKEDIHRLSMVPDLSDLSFGGNLSGVAIRYKLLGFEQQIKNKERNFAKSLRKRFTLYNHFLTVKSRMEAIPSHRVDIVFNHNLPANELEIAQMVSTLKGTVSDVTLLSQIPFVSDAEEEYRIASAQHGGGQEPLTHPVGDDTGDRIKR